jgi:hypothetical protein
MGYAKKKGKTTRWVSVPLQDRLHEEVRARAVRRRMAWPDIVAEALALWLHQLSAGGHRPATRSEFIPTARRRGPHKTMRAPLTFNSVPTAR